MNILFQDKGDGGEFVLSGGDLKQDETLFSALYLSLFQGENFYNIYEKYKTNNDFELALNLPITRENLIKTETLASEALNWMLDVGLVLDIKVEAKGDIKEKQNVDITIKEPSGDISRYGIIWQNERMILTKKN